jgi:hypothetical protein
MLRLDSSQHTCMVTCPAGMFADERNVCQPCEFPCSRCNSAPDFCDACLPDSGSPYLRQNIGKCYAQCEEGFYLQHSTQTCERCTGNCNTCVSQNECLTCNHGSYFFAGQCLDSCPVTSIAFKSTEVNECQQCKENCLSCSGTVDTCTTCLPGFLLHKSQCVSKCPANYQPDPVDSTCFKANEFTMPFVTMSVTIGILLVVVASNIKTYDTRPFSAFLALESSWLVVFWFYYAFFLIKDGHSASTILVAFALLSNYIINYLFYEFWRTRLCKEDTQYQQYREDN